MHKILIFGNSGSGKSTLAKRLAAEKNLAHLDLDTLAWLPVIPVERASLLDSEQKIKKFTLKNERWVIEGGYTDLLEILSSQADQLIFMNLTPSQCIENAKNRPWEPHKYESKEAQDQNLEMLIGWIKQYADRDDIFSLSAHTKFYHDFPGDKCMYESNSTTTLELL